MANNDWVCSTYVTRLLFRLFVLEFVHSTFFGFRNAVCAQPKLYEFDLGGAQGILQGPIFNKKLPSFNSDKYSVNKKQ